MERAWIIAGVVVPALGMLGGALMALTDQSAHFAACAAFLLAGGWLAVTGLRWMREVHDWNWTVRLYAAGIALGVLLAPLMIWFAWPSAQAQTPPAVSGNCNNFGNNNFNCNTLNLGPPRQTNALYQNGRFLGTVGGIEVGQDGKSVTLTNPHLSGLSMDLAGNLELQGAIIHCPALAQASNPGADLNYTVNGTITCTIVGKRQ